MTPLARPGPESLTAGCRRLQEPPPRCSAERSRAFHLLPAFLLTFLLAAQEQPPIITRYTVEGNQVTREHIILRELSHPLREPFDSTLALQDRHRLYNLGIFESVEVYPRPTGAGEAELVVQVVETVRMVPVPVLYYLEDLESWAYGGGLAYLNFRGLNQRLDLLATFGAETAYNFTFSDPWFAGDEIGIAAHISRTYRGHPVDSLRIETRDFLDVTVMKSYFKKILQLSASVSIEQRLLHQYGDLERSLAKGVQALPYMVLETRFDLHWRDIDVWRDPTRGLRVRLHVSPILGLNETSPTYTYLFARWAWFYPLKWGYQPTILGLSGAVSHYSREVHPYLYQYLGSTWVRGYEIDPMLNPLNVRGHLETTSLTAASIELRQTLIPRRLWHSLELGLGMVLFLDIGWGYGPDQPLREAHPIVGYGAGLRFFVPILQVVALDLGANPYQADIHARLRFSHSF